MSTLHGRMNGLTSDPILAAKGVRDALASLRMPDATLERAAALVEVAQKRGLVLVATHGSPERCRQAAQAGMHGSNGHMAFYVDLSREEALGYQKFEARPLRSVPPPDPTPITKAEPNAAATMAVVMAMCNGNPLVAAAHCQNLARTASAPVFLQARALLIEGFPWIEAKLDAGDIA